MTGAQGSIAFCPFYLLEESALNSFIRILPGSNFFQPDSHGYGGVAADRHKRCIAQRECELSYLLEDDETFILSSLRFLMEYATL